MAINIKGSKPKTTPTKTNETDLTNIGEETAQGASETPQESNPEVPPTDAPDTSQAPTQPAQTAPGHQTGASFLVTGNQQKSQVSQIAAMQEIRSKLNNSVREFWLEPGQFAKGYFLDGKLLDDGVFDTPMINTHFLQIGGRWARFICNQHTEGSCVVCDSNADSTQVQTHQLFTMINIMPYTIQNGPNKGKTLPARLQLFAATLKVREKLVKRAKNHGDALTGSIYQFSRTSKQDPRTGDDIEYVQEVPMQGVLQKYPMLQTVYDPQKKEYKDAPTTVFDYAKVYPVLTNAEIATLRPDLGGMAGFSPYSPKSAPATGFGVDPTTGIDDDIPF